MAHAHRRTSTTCPACGETNPPQFDICWSCGADLTGPGATERPTNIDPDGSTLGDAQSSQPTAALVQQSVVSVSSRRWNDWLELTAVVLATCVARYAAQVLSPPQVTHDIDWSTLAVSIPSYVGLTILLWLLICRDRLALQPKPIQSSPWLQEILIGAAIGAASIFVALMLTTIGSAPIRNGLPRFEIGESIGGNLCLHLIYGFFGVMYEEAVFRVYLQAKLQSLMPGKVTMSVVISAALFAVVHAFSLKGTLKAFASGLIFGTAYQITQRFPRVVLGHWFNNLYAILLR